MIYVASSWRNPRYEGILDCLEQWNIAYYNWRDEEGFHWSDVFSELVWTNDAGKTVNTMQMHIDHWTDPIPPEMFARAMRHQRAQQGFERDMRHLEEAEAVILLLPCGKSAHLEAGWAVGSGKPTVVYAPEDLQPELMYGMFGQLITDIDELMRWAASHTKERIKVWGASA